MGKQRKTWTAQQKQAIVLAALRGFTRIIGQSYWRLRDYRRSLPRRPKVASQYDHLVQQVRLVALEAPTYGYRRLWYLLRNRGVWMGRDRLRRLLRTQGLSQVLIRKRRRSRAVMQMAEDWHEERWIQIDATRLSLADGVCWVYLVEDVASRVCLASSVGPSVNTERSAETLLAGRDRLVEMGLDEPLLVQSDGGSDFISERFQNCCAQLG